MNERTRARTHTHTHTHTYASTSPTHYYGYWAIALKRALPRASFLTKLIALDNSSQHRLGRLDCSHEALVRLCYSGLHTHTRIITRRSALGCVRECANI